MSWDPITTPIDYVLLAGKRSPGIARVTGVSAPRKWDELNGYGLSGAYPRYTGDALTNFSAWLKFTEAREIQEYWDKFFPLLKKGPYGRIPKALSWWHPHTEPFGVKSVVVTDVSQLEEIRESTGAWMVEIKLKQFRRPTPQYSAPKSAETKAKDPFDQRIEQKTKELEQLTKQYTELAK